MYPDRLVLRVLFTFSFLLQLSLIIRIVY